MDSGDHIWRIEKRIVLKGWRFAASVGGTIEEAINAAAKILDSEEAVYQVRIGNIAERGHWYYIPQWLE